MSLILSETPSSGGSDSIVLLAGENISSFSAVAVHEDGLAYKASAADVDDAGRVVGVATTSALTGGDINISGEGEISNNGFLFTPGRAVFLGLDGALVQTPGLGNFEQPMGVALSASEMLVEVGLAIVFA